MIRILFTYVLPLFLPTAIYLLWLRFSARRGSVREVPWVWLALMGVALAGLVLLAANLFGGTRNGVYVPPHTEGGRIVPGRVVPAQ